MNEQLKFWDWDQREEGQRREAFGAEDVADYAPLADPEETPFTVGPRRRRSRLGLGKCIRCDQQLDEFGQCPGFAGDFKVTATDNRGIEMPVRIAEPFAHIEGSSTFEDTIQDIYNEAFRIMVERQRRYGPKNIEQQGMWGVLTRLSDDKLSRIKRAFNGSIEHGAISLSPIEETDDVETFEDAVLDAINYLVILLLLKRGLWGRPLREEAA